MMATMFTSCFHNRTNKHSVPVTYSHKQLDSITFYQTHHYGTNFNFVVKGDSIMLMRQLPEEAINGMPTDSFVVHEGDHLVVADIRIIPKDSIDSVWIQLAQNQTSFGWIHESQLLQNVDPDDPISQFISTFSNVHLLIFLVVICVITVGYGMRKLFRRNAHIVHFNDISSFYPTLLTLIVASSATFYSSIQLFAPDEWRHFYFHPTLNPFSLPTILAVFLCSVWAMLIVGIAAVDDTLHQLSFGDAVLYICGLAGVCAVDYIIFSLTTLYYIGYVFLAMYYIYALWRYFNYSRNSFVCGNCGAILHTKGTCPHCGVMND